MSEDQRIRDLLVKKYERWAVAVAQKKAREVGLQGHDLEEAVGAAREELVRVAHRFDPKRGVNFTAFAKHRVEGRVLDEQRKVLRTLETERKVIASLACEPGPPSLEDKAEIRDLLRKAAGVLTGVERHILDERYGQDKTFVEIAEKRGVSKSWVGRLCERAESKLRRSLLKQEAKERLREAALEEELERGRSL